MSQGSGGKHVGLTWFAAGVAASAATLVIFRSFKKGRLAILADGARDSVDLDELKIPGEENLPSSLGSCSPPVPMVRSLSLGTDGQSSKLPGRLDLNRPSPTSTVPSGPRPVIKKGGHVFITRADLTQIACDAWLLPADEAMCVESYWDPGPQVTAFLRDLVSNWQSRSTGKRLVPVTPWKKKSNQPWVSALSEEGRPLQWYRDGIEEFLRKALRSLKEGPQSRGPANFRETYLLAVPLVRKHSISSGGDNVGLVLQDTVEFLYKMAGELEIDIAWVILDESMFTAAQVVRDRMDTAAAWGCLGQRDGNEFKERLLAKVKKLARIARDSRLGLFLGSGVSVGAGLPVWGQLLTDLAKNYTDLTETEIGTLKTMNVLDAPHIIESRLRPGVKLGEAVSSRLKVDYYSLCHSLLSSLPCECCVTTNYDDLFERASAAQEVTCSIIPYKRVRLTKRWILKMHGCVSAPDEIVLKRGDYLGYDSTKSALASVLQALMVTKHILFVGFSLSDDNFHRVASAARDIHSSENSSFGTVLSIVHDKFQESLWPDLDMVFTVPDEKPISYSARQQEIFLDKLTSTVSLMRRQLFSNTFMSLRSPEEKTLREYIIGFAQAVPARVKGLQAWRHMTEVLRGMVGPDFEDVTYESSTVAPFSLDESGRALSIAEEQAKVPQSSPPKPKVEKCVLLFLGQKQRAESSKVMTGWGMPEVAQGWSNMVFTSSEPSMDSINQVCGDLGALRGEARYFVLDMNDPTCQSQGIPHIARLVKHISHWADENSVIVVTHSQPESIRIVLETTRLHGSTRKPPLVAVSNSLDNVGEAILLARQAPSKPLTTLPARVLDGGHVFVTRTCIQHIQCDAWLCPCDSALGISAFWHVRPIPQKAYDRFRNREHPVMKLHSKYPANADVWVLDVAAGGSEYLIKKLNLFFRKVADDLNGSRRQPRGGRSRHLIAIPVIGTGFGGNRHRTGRVVREILSELYRATELYGYDAVLVTWEEATYAAAQSARIMLARGSSVEKTCDDKASEHGKADEPDQGFGSESTRGSGVSVWSIPEEARATAIGIAEDIINGNVALVLGRELAFGGGVTPCLEDHLVDEIEMSQEDRDLMGKLSTLEKMDVIKRRYACNFRERAVEVLQPSFKNSYGLIHSLIEQLGVYEHVSIGQDCMFENAVRIGNLDGKRDLVCLPKDKNTSAHGGKNCLVIKMNGSVDDEETLILSHSDYAKARRTRRGLQSHIQALFVTKRVVIIGMSTTDSFLHDIIHSVKQAMEPGSSIQPSAPTLDHRRKSRALKWENVRKDKVATMVTVGEPGLVKEIWGDDMEFISVDARMRRHSANELNSEEITPFAEIEGRRPMTNGGESDTRPGQSGTRKPFNVRFREQEMYWDLIAAHVAANTMSSHICEERFREILTSEETELKNMITSFLRNIPEECRRLPAYAHISNKFNEFGVLTQPLLSKALKADLERVTPEAPKQKKQKGKQKAGSVRFNTNK